MAQEQIALCKSDRVIISAVRAFSVWAALTHWHDYRRAMARGENNNAKDAK